MNNPARSRREHRDIGLVKIGAWTRRAVAAGVVFCGVLGAGLAHRLPGQAAAAEHDDPPATSSRPSPSSPSPTVRPRRHPRRLAPPGTTPRLTSDPTHATSGGS